MKKILLAICLLSFLSVSYSQENSEKSATEKVLEERVNLLTLKLDSISNVLQNHSSHSASNFELASKFFISGNIGFETTSAKSVVADTNYNNPNAYGSYYFSPVIGYYFGKDLAIGLQLGYSSYTYNGINFQTVNYQKYKITCQVLSISPLMRYFIPLSGKVGINFNFTLPYSYTRYNDMINNNGTTNVSNVISGDNDIPGNYSSYSVGINLSPGIEWFLKKYLSISCSFGGLGYTHYKTVATSYIHNESSTNVNDIKLSLSTNISLGASFYFGGK